MKRTFPILLAMILSVGLEQQAAAAEDTPPPPAATPAPPPSAPAKRSAAELEKLAMPIALHPDPLIAVLLPASVYPLEIVQAARFVKDTNNIPKVDEQPWDDNVKAVAKFPQLIAQMDADLAWTVGLGQAFLDQPKELMDTIQGLRSKAQKAGTLQNTPQQIITVTNMVTEKIVEQQTVVVTNTVVQIQPSSPEVVYVPSYPPTVYYPPPGYVYSPYAPLVTFGLGMAAGAIIANNWNHCDWHGGSVNVNNVNINNNNNINRNNNVSRNNSVNRGSGAGNQQKWQPDQKRLNSSGAASSARSGEARGWGGGEAGSQTGQRAGAGTGGARSAQQPAGNRSQGLSANTQPGRSPGAGQGSSVSQRPTSSAGGARPSASPAAASRPSSSGSSAFSGVGSGSSARSSSSRGSSSMGGGGGRSGGGGGRSGGGGGRSGGGGRR